MAVTVKHYALEKYVWSHFLLNWFNKMLWTFTYMEYFTSDWAPTQFTKSNFVNISIL